MIGIAVLCCALAVLALIPERGLGQLGRLSLTERPKESGRSQKTIILLCVVVGLVTAALLGGVVLLGWVLAGLIVVGTVAGISWRSYLDRQARKANREVVRAARGLAGQLRIGQVPVAALPEAAKDSPVLRHAAEVSRIGGDVVAALRSDALEPGQSGLADIAAAWELCTRTGAPVADAVDAVAETLRRMEASRDAVQVEAATARITGRIMAVLPLVGIVLGYMAGGDPLDFLTSNLVGEALLVVGLGLAASGVWWLELMADRACRE